MDHGAVKNGSCGFAAAPCSLSKKSLRDFSPSCFQNCKMKFCSIILQFCRCGGLLNAKGNPDGFLSHFSSLRNFRLDRFFDSLRSRCTRSGACVLWGELQGRGRREWKMDNWKWKAESARLTGLSLRGGRRPTWQSREGTADSHRLSIKAYQPIASVAALTAQPLAALPPYGCGVPLAGCERLVRSNSTA